MMMCLDGAQTVEAAGNSQITTDWWKTAAQKSPPTLSVLFTLVTQCSIYVSWKKPLNKDTPDKMPWMRD